MAGKRIGLFATLMGFALMCAAGCELGTVDQGRVVKYDRDKRQVTIIRDSASDPKNPQYDHLPPLTYELPDLASETGPEPAAGGRLKLDTKNRQIVIYDDAAKNFRTIEYTLIDQRENVSASDPAVFDRSEGRPVRFPVVDREKKTISIYSATQKMLVTFSLPEEYFSLPDHTWEAGDVVRIYYKKEGKAERFMNVSKTDIYKK